MNNKFIHHSLEDRRWRHWQPVSAEGASWFMDGPSCVVTWQKGTQSFYSMGKESTTQLRLALNHPPDLISDLTL
jgi:hypothetical protein